jgi:hypothetical protein
LFVGCLVLSAAAIAPPATPATKPLQVRQLEFPIPLVAPGDIVEVGYDTRSVRSAKGYLYVRNDLQSGFTRVALMLRKAKQQLVPSDGLKLLRAVVPGGLLRGHRLFYYGVVRDPKTGRSARIPAGAPESLWVLGRSTIVNLGTHGFGHPRAAEAVVAQAGPGDVGFENPPEGARFGPWSFDVGRDGSIWLLDELSQRLLVWQPGQPDTVARSVPLPFYPIDFALGPADTLYVTRPANPTDPPAYPGGLPPIRLDHLSAAGEVLWESRLATDIFNTQLRAGPDGTLYWTGPFPSPRIERGSERRWTPAATPAGEPLTVSEQNRGTLWGDQPLPGGLRLLAAAARFEPDAVYGLAPHEERFALINPTGGLVRGWRASSRTVIFPVLEATPDLVGGDPVVVIQATVGSGSDFKWEYIVLRLARAGGTRARFSLSHDPPDAAWGDVVTDIRVGPDGNLYQLGSLPTLGVVISRYPLSPSGSSDSARRGRRPQQRGPSSSSRSPE